MGGVLWTESMDEPTDDDSKDQTNIFDVIPTDIVPLILSHLTNRQRCKVATVSKLFNEAIQLVVNDSITIHWNHEIKTHRNSDLQQVEQQYNNLIKFDIIGQLAPNFKIVGNIEENEDGNNDQQQQQDDIGNVLHLSGDPFDIRILVNDRIDLKWTLINLQRFHRAQSFQQQYELGVLITTQMTTNNRDIGGWNIGFVLGSNLFAFHPGFNGFWGNAGPAGPARLEGANGWNNETMHFVPQCDQLCRVQLFINQKSHVYMKIHQGKQEYARDWKHQGSLFQDDQCTTLRANIFAIRTENSHAHISPARARVAQFGYIEMRVGKRCLQTGTLSIC